MTSVVNRCSNCGLTHQCICTKVPKLDNPVQIALLTHENELSRETNTGHWAHKMLPHCEVHVWQRKVQPERLIEQIKSGDYRPLVVFPGEDSQLLEQKDHHDLNTLKAVPPLYIVIDATWQEAKKMLNKSTWLQALPKVELATNQASGYHLRRNQSAGNLCTLEVVAELLRVEGDGNSAEQIAPFLDFYMASYQADKSGHALKAK